MTYTLVIVDTETTATEYVPLAAKTQKSVTPEVTRYIAANDLAGKQVYVSFSRENDGQIGYINRDGASSFTGKAW